SNVRSKESRAARSTTTTGLAVCVGQFCFEHVLNTVSIGSIFPAKYDSCCSETWNERALQFLGNAHSTFPSRTTKYASGPMDVLLLSFSLEFFASRGGKKSAFDEDGAYGEKLCFSRQKKANTWSHRHALVQTLPTTIQYYTVVGVGMVDPKLHVLDACAAAMPTWLESLVELRHLWLHNSHVVGPIPEALGALKELTFLYLDTNNLT
ncbi:unnamed protein product, partial [Ectocarpus sp. 12 AP-2014]